MILQDQELRSEAAQVKPWIVFLKLVQLTSVLKGSSRLPGIKSVIIGPLPKWEKQRLLPRRGDITVMDIFFVAHFASANTSLGPNEFNIHKHSS